MLLCVDSVGDIGGLVLLWKKEIGVQLRSMYVHHIDVEILDGMGDVPWRFTGFYRWPKLQNHHLSWKLLGELASQANLSWLCMGDLMKS